MTLMIDLQVFIEIEGINKLVGKITGSTLSLASFKYSESYLEDKANKAISISLPLEEREFSPDRTKNFFEGLLPEGFTRRCVAQWLHITSLKMHAYHVFTALKVL